MPDPNLEGLPSAAPGARGGGLAAVSGVLLLVAGLAGMAAIVAAAYGRSPEAFAWAYRLGLPGSLAASAVAQILVLTGGWLCWRALRRTR